VNLQNVHSTAFSQIKTRLFGLSNGVEIDLREVLQGLKMMLMGSGDSSVDRADCFIALCDLVRNGLHRDLVLQWIEELVVSVEREHRVFSELVVEFFVPLLQPPTVHEKADLATLCGILQLLKSPRTASVVISAYCDLYSSPPEVKFRLKSDVTQLNAIKSCGFIDLDEANLDSEIAYWLT